MKYKNLSKIVMYTKLLFRLLCFLFQFKVTYAACSGIKGCDDSFILGNDFMFFFCFFGVLFFIFFGNDVGGAGRIP